MIRIKVNDKSDAVLDKIDDFQLRDIVNSQALYATMPNGEDNVFENYDVVEKATKYLKTLFKKRGITYFSKDQLTVTALAMLLAQRRHMRIPEDYLPRIAMEARIFHEDDKEVRQNPYLLSITVDGEHRVGSSTLTQDRMAKYEVEYYDTVKRLENNYFVPRMSVFDSEFVYPVIRDKGNTWMSITPNEIFTMRQNIENARGKVLTFGCGLGYFAYMASLKDTVESVTIVEKSEEVIELFTKYILPQFEKKDKIEIVQADAFDYMEHLTDGEYDYCFVDIWMSANDHAPYLHCKAIEKRKHFEKTQFDYWIEDALLDNLMPLLNIIIRSEFDGVPLLNHFNREALEDEEMALMDMLRYLEDIFGDSLQVNKPADAIKILNANTFKELLDAAVKS